MNYTDLNYINLSIGADEMEKILKQQIEYDIFIERESAEMKRIDELVSIAGNVAVIPTIELSR